MRPSLWPLAFVFACGFTAARAGSVEYTISVPDGQEATFAVPIKVDYAGSVTIDATWTGPRLLFFGVEGPGHVSLARRSGPPSRPAARKARAHRSSAPRGTVVRPPAVPRPPGRDR
jgi:hypothetical protein